MDFNAFLLRTKFWIDDFLKGSPIGKPFREIKFIQESSFDQGYRIRKKALDNLLKYAQQNSSFYHNVEGNNLKDFPIMTKKELLENYDSIKIEERLIPNQIGVVHIQTTSGSTGTPFKIPQDTCKRLRRIAELKYFGSIAGFKTHDKLIHLRTWNKWQQKTSKQSKQENIIPFDIARLGDEQLQELCDLIVSSKAICLRGYASSLAKLAEFAEGKNYHFPHLKLAIAGAEALQDDARSLFKRVMGAEIQSQYANEECGILAQEKVPTMDSDNPMYLNHSGYFFEVLKFDSDDPVEYGELGRIVITDLYNYAFPLIRYDNGDTAILGEPDEFSNGYPIIKKLYGRRFDITYSTNGIPIFPLTFGRILKHYDFISQWQFIQESEFKYVLKVILRDNQSTFDEIINNLKEYLGDNAQIDIMVVEDIPVLSSGKRKPVVNNWKK